MDKNNLDGQINMFDYMPSFDANGKDVIRPGKLRSRKAKVEAVAEVKTEAEVVVEPVAKTEVEAEAKVEPVVTTEIEVEPVEETVVVEPEEVATEPEIDESQNEVDFRFSGSDVVMHRSINDSAGRAVKSVSYINYNKVKVVTNYDDEKIYSFESSKEAVDFYIDKMQNLKKL